MSRAPIIRRPHGPINQAFPLMWFDFESGKVRFDPKPAAQQAPEKETA